MSDLSGWIKDRAIELGFDLVGICPAVAPSGFSQLADWIASGCAGQMTYLSDRLPAYEHPEHVLSGVRSLVMLGMHYRTQAPVVPAAGQARISRYAWGSEDYHDVIHQRLKQLQAAVLREAPEARVRGVVDTAPLLEREFARLAGLGWIGKNTMLINRPAGSWFFLASLLTDFSLDYDAPFLADHCGTCRACLDACPTQAFPAPYVLDATRCISYWTIEHRDAVPAEQRGTLGDWLFGCDICQEVCPWNRRTPPARQAGFMPLESQNPVELAAWFTISEEGFRERFRRTPLWRSRRRGILRNAAIVLGNQRAASALDALRIGLDDPEPLVRGAAAWALGELDNPDALQALRSRLERERDPAVCGELQRVLTLGPGG